MSEFPSTARTVIIGGGINGCSVASMSDFKAAIHLPAAPKHALGELVA